MTQMIFHDPFADKESTPKESPGEGEAADSPAVIGLIVELKQAVQPLPNPFAALNPDIS